MIVSTINHEQRQKSLHSTDVSAILGLNPKRDGHTVFLEKNGRIEPFAGNDATDMGNWLEPSILNIAESELGPLERNVVCRAAEVDCPLVATLDSSIVATRKPCEAKTSGIVGPIYGDWGDEGTDVVPQQYLVQASVQMLCSGSDLVHLYALLGGRGLVRYRILRDEELISVIVDHCSRWWDRHIEQGVEPERTGPVPMEIVKRIRRKPKKVIELGPESLMAVAEYDALKTAVSDEKKLLEGAQSNLIMLLGDAEAGLLPDGRMVRYGSQHRRGYTVDPCDYRVLRVLESPPADWLQIESPADAAPQVDYKVAERKQIPEWIKVRMLNQNPHCKWCGATLTRQTATIEHLAPLSKGGTNDEHNLALACVTCNRERGDDASLPTTVSMKG